MFTLLLTIWQYGRSGRAHLELRNLQFFIDTRVFAVLYDSLTGIIFITFFISAELTTASQNKIKLVESNPVSVTIKAEKEK